MYLSGTISKPRRPTTVLVLSYRHDLFLTETISIEDLKQQIMYLFKMSETAFTYLALSIHHQESSPCDDDILQIPREVPYR